MSYFVERLSCKFQLKYFCNYLVTVYTCTDGVSLIAEFWLLNYPHEENKY